jgi:protein tyrosine/serine phosphatase
MIGKTTTTSERDMAMSGRCALAGIRSGTVLLLGASALINGCVTTAPVTAHDARPAQWATPVAASPGLPNLHRVNATLYRSAQPSREGFVRLDSHLSLASGDPPIRTVVSLRTSRDDASLITKSSALRLEEISFKTWHPEDEDVVEFLRIVTTPALQPVLVHCRHGSDRTGTMVAVYRIVIEGWTKAEATDEMIHGGFGFHPLWQNLLRYIEALDVDAIRAQVAAQGPWQ